MSYPTNQKQPHETDLAFARRNASDTVAALREVIYVLETDRLTKDNALGWANQAMAMTIQLVDYLHSNDVRVTFREFSEVCDEARKLRAVLESIASISDTASRERNP